MFTEQDIEGSAERAVMVPGPGLQRFLNVTLYALASAIVAGWIGLVSLHLNDDYRVAHLQGNWVAASEAARTGHLYPPPYEDGHYAGTRWMPLAILANALASRVVGDPWTAGKLLAALLMAALLGLTASALRAGSCPWPLTAGLCASVVATETGLQAGTTIGGDLLPVVLQVAALVPVLRRPQGAALVIAGALAALAVIAKLTALWALLAVPTWLLAQRRTRAAAIFLGASAVTLVVGVGVVEILAKGELTRQLLWFSAAGVAGAPSIWRAPNQLLFNLRGYAVATIVLLPLALLGSLMSAGWRRLTLIDFALIYALFLILVIYSDLGTGWNQLLDLVVLTALAVGQLVGRGAHAAHGMERTTIGAAVALAVIWAGSLDLVRTVGYDLRRSVAAVVAGERGTRAAQVVAGMVQPQDEVLSEDPSIEVALGRRPIVLDPFMLTRLDRLHPEWVDPLISRIVEQRFRLVVLVVSLEDRSLDFWWSDYHFGPRIAKALRESYRPDGSVGRFYLYRPREK